MRSLKHPLALIGIPGPCYRGAVVTWHVGISSSRKSSVPVLGVPVVSHGWRTAGSSHALTTSFPMSGIQTSFGVHRGRQIGITSSCLQSWAMVSLLWTRNCTNIHLYNEGSVLDFFNFMNLEPTLFLGHRQRSLPLPILTHRDRSRVPNKRVKFILFQISHSNKK